MAQKKPVLYYVNLSPPSRAVLLTAAAIGLELELRVMSLLNGDHLAPDFVKINPQHTLPTLDDNGVILYDSHVICSYLVDKYGKDDSLYPKDLIKRSLVQTRLYFDTGYLFCRMRFLFEPIFYFGGSEAPQEKLDYIEKTYSIMEAFLKDTPYLCGDNLTIGDFACVSSLSSIDQVVKMDKGKYPKLLAWMERMAELPYYKEKCDVGGKEVQSLFIAKLKENKEKAN